MLQFGIITEVNAETGKARVKFPELDNIVSSWLPISVPKILTDKYSIPFDINEPVWCVMDEHCENGIIAGAYPNKNALPDGGEASKVRVKFNHSLTIEFDRDTSTLSIEGNGKININVDQECNITCQSAKIESLTKVEVIAAAEVDITAPLTKITGPLTVIGIVTAGGFAGSATSGGPGDMSIDGNITATGDIESTGGEVKVGTINLSTHKHNGVQTGGGLSGTPV
jgi:phage baseplate assembly protein gpV